MKHNASRQKSKKPRKLGALVDQRGRVRLLEKVRLSKACRAWVTLLDEPATVKVNGTAALSEPALAEDWNRPEEDKAWSHLQPEA
jgi:hypothetical protein